MDIEWSTISKTYALFLDPLVSEKLVLNGSPVRWDGKQLIFIRQPHIRVVPGKFHLRDVRVNGMTVPDWNRRSKDDRDALAEG